MARLSVQLDGKTVFLYRFSRGCYDDRQIFLCVHPEFLLPEQVRQKVAEAALLLPEKIDFDYSGGPGGLDLFEQAVELAGFVRVDGDTLLALNLPMLSALVTERDFLLEALARK